MIESYNKKSRIFRILLNLLIILTIIFIWSNSARTGLQSHGYSNIIVDILRPLFDPQGNISYDDFSFAVRKAAHFSEFALLGAELLIKAKITGSRERFTIPFIMLSVAVADETIQLFFDRTSSVSDVIIDFCGGIFGILIALLVITITGLLRQRCRNKSRKN